MLTRDSKIVKVIGKILADRVQNELSRAREKIHVMLSFPDDQLLEFLIQFRPKSYEVIEINHQEQLEKFRNTSISAQSLPVFVVWAAKENKTNGWLITSIRDMKIGHLVVLMNQSVSEKESIALLKRISAADISTREIIDSVLSNNQLTNEQYDFVHELRNVTKCTIQDLISYLESVKNLCRKCGSLDKALGVSLPLLHLFCDPDLLYKTQIQIHDRLRKNVEYSSLVVLESLYETRIIPRLESGKIKLSPEKFELINQYLKNQKDLDVFSKVSYEDFHNMVRTNIDSRSENIIEESMTQFQNADEESSVSPNTIDAPNILLGLAKILAKYCEPSKSKRLPISSIILSYSDDEVPVTRVSVSSLHENSPSFYQQLMSVRDFLIKLIERKIKNGNSSQEESSMEEESYLEIDVTLENKSVSSKKADSYILRLEIDPELLQLCQKFYNNDGSFLSAKVDISSFEDQIANAPKILSLYSVDDLKNITPSYLSEDVNAFMNARRKFIKGTQFGETIFIATNIEEYLNSYARLLKKINLEEYSADDEPPFKFIQLLMQIDCIYTQDMNQALMLPFHPLRVRWRYCYEKWLLDIMKSLAADPENYNHVDMDLLIDVKLRGVPPIICLDRDRFLVNYKSVGFYEIYTTRNFLVSNVRPTLVTRRIDEYLKLCPFARQGLKINFVNAGDGDFAFRALKDVLKDDEKLKIETYLYDDKAGTKLGEVFDRESDERTDITERFFMRHNNEFLPRLVYLKRYQNPIKVSEDKVHISVLSDLRVSKVDTIGLRGNYIKAYENAEEENLFGISIFSNHYEVVSAKSIEPRRIYLVASDDWLSMHYQQCCFWVEHGAPPRGSRSYIMESNLDDVEQLIMELHQKSDWVIIFDESIYREYLEAPKRNIKILDVRTGLGTQEAFTMTVSSINDEVVKQSIGKILGRVLEHDYKQAYSDCIFGQLRHLSGKLTLQCATGNDSKIREMLGDILAINIDKNDSPTVVIPLDDYTEWFKAEERQNRADILKVSLQNDELFLGIIEAKFISNNNARNDIEKARRQLDNTEKVIKKLFAPKTDTKRLDFQLQYERLYHAIIDHNISGSNNVFDEDTLGIIRNGIYKKINVNTYIYCFIHDTLTANIDRDYLSDAGLFKKDNEIIKGRDDIISYLDALLGI